MWHENAGKTSWLLYCRRHLDHIPKEPMRWIELWQDQNWDQFVVILSHLFGWQPYRTKIRRTKLSKFRLGFEHFVRRKFCPIFQYKSQAKIGQNCRKFSLVSKILTDEIFWLSKILSNISIQKSVKNRTKVSKFRLGIENFLRRKFVRQNFVR